MGDTQHGPCLEAEAKLLANCKTAVLHEESASVQVLPRKAIIAKRPCLISAVFRRNALASSALAKPRGSKAPPADSHRMYSLTAQHSSHTSRRHSFCAEWSKRILKWLAIQHQMPCIGCCHVVKFSVQRPLLMMMQVTEPGPVPYGDGSSICHQHHWYAEKVRLGRDSASCIITPSKEPFLPPFSIQPRAQLVVRVQREQNISE